jgi:GDP-4-dehydro-6-deoxy-D-mannose reductase
MGDQVLGTCFGGDSMPAADSSVSYCGLDITDGSEVARVVNEYQPDVLYHLAGIAFVPRAGEQFPRTLLTNVGGTVSLLRACEQLPAPPTFIMISTGEVYGKISSDQLPVTEETPACPANYYALSKLMAEQAVQHASRSGVVRAAILRPSNHTGARQSDDFVVSSFAHQLAEIAVGVREPVLRVGNLDAERDFSDVRDIVRAYRLVAETGYQGVLNVASGRPVAIRDILDHLVEISGISVTIELDERRMRPSEVPVLYSSYERLRTVTGWVPHYELKDTIAEVYRYWLAVETAKQALFNRTKGGASGALGI